MIFDRLPDPLRPREDPAASESRGGARIAFALALGLAVFLIQYLLLLGWEAATDVTVVEALAGLLGLERSGLPGYFLLYGLGILLFATISLAVTYALAIVVLRSRKLALFSVALSVGLILLTGVVALAVRSSGTQVLAGRTAELQRVAEERVERLAEGTRIEGLRVESGPTYASMGATADNPRPEWGELRWGLRVLADLRVPDAGVYDLTVEYRLPGAEEWHARTEEELVLEVGSNPLEVVLDANDSRDYQGFWPLRRAGGSLQVVLRRTLEPEELYGNELPGVMERARRISGEAAGAIEPTSRSVELLRESIEL